VGQRVNAPSDALPLSRNDAALIAQRDALIAALQVQNAMLARTVSGLERHVVFNSSSSGAPPSSEGLKKPSRVMQPAAGFKQVGPRV